jgi:hypothetical protein
LYIKASYGILEGPVEIWGIKFESAHKLLWDFLKVPWEVWGIIFESALGGVVGLGAKGSALALRAART